MRFWFHYNKPASQRAKKPQISVHIQGACHIVDNVCVGVPTVGRVRNRQPFFVMTGECEKWKMVGKEMVLQG